MWGLDRVMKPSASSTLLIAFGWFALAGAMLWAVDLMGLAH